AGHGTVRPRTKRQAAPRTSLAGTVVCFALRWSPYRLATPGAAMAHPPAGRIHPTAVISADATMAEDVEGGPFVVIEGPVRLGPGCVVRPHAHLIGPLTMGRGNIVHSGAVLGDRPQHQRFAGEPSGVIIGDENTFREGVTVHAGTTPDHPTKIG